MGFLDWFKREKRLIDYSPEELRREEGRLQIRESHAIARIEKAEEEREAIFRRGFEVRSEIRRRILARQHEEKDREIVLLERNLERLSKEALTVSSIRYRLVRRAQGQSGLLKKVGGREIDTLREPFESDEVNEEEFAEKLAGVLGAMEEDGGDPLAGLSESARAVLETWSEADAEGDEEADGEVEEGSESDEA